MKAAYKGIDDLQFYTNIEVAGDRVSVILRDALNPGNEVGQLDGPKASVRAALNDWADRRVASGELTFRFWEHDLRDRG